MDSASLDGRPGDRDNCRFANILLAGPCNLSCPHCIGRQLGAVLPANLQRFPLAGLDRFVATVRAQHIDEVSVSGTNTDPLLYRPAHHHALCDLLRARLPGVRLSLHTNGLLALARREVLSRYDRATISFCSFDPPTCLSMTGRAQPIDLARIAAAVRIPLKLSLLVTGHNAHEAPAIIDRARQLGIRRLVLRRLVTPAASPAEPTLLQRLPWLARRAPVKHFGGNPVYSLPGGIELTLWDFARSRLRCLNLFSDGTIGEHYALARSLAGRPAAAQQVHHG